MRARSAVILDRDGVINVSPRGRYVKSWNQFRFLPGAFEALRLLRARRRIVIVISNQSGVGRGVVSNRSLKEMTLRMLEAVREARGQIHAVYYCTHHPSDGCPCRKPRLGMLQKAARRFSIDLKRSFVVGDNVTDILMGRSAGCRTVVVRTGRHSKEAIRHRSIVPDRVAKDLPEAVRWILKQR